MEKVLITGASRGLGYALADSYASAGFYVIACARNVDSSALQKLKGTYKDNIYVVAMDVAKTDSVEKAATQIELAVSSIDIVINNAAIHSEDSSLELEKINVDNCLETYNVNALGALRVAKAFISLLDKGYLKVLVNISSEAGSISNCNRGKEFDYCMSKAALNMESKMLQNYLKDRNIKVLAIHPGWIKTEMGGPNADISSSEAAKGIIDITEKYRQGEKELLYIDYTGKPMEF